MHGNTVNCRFPHKSHIIQTLQHIIIPVGIKSSHWLYQYKKVIHCCRQTKIGKLMLPFLEMHLCQESATKKWKAMYIPAQITGSSNLIINCERVLSVSFSYDYPFKLVQNICFNSSKMQTYRDIFLPGNGSLYPNQIYNLRSPTFELWMRPDREKMLLQG